MLPDHETNGRFADRRRLEVERATRDHALRHDRDAAASRPRTSPVPAPADADCRPCPPPTTRTAPDAV